MVIFGLPVFYLFSLPVNFLAFRFSIYSAFRIWPKGSARAACEAASFLPKIFHNFNKIFVVFEIFVKQSCFLKYQPFPAMISLLVFSSRFRHVSSQQYDLELRRCIERKVLVSCNNEELFCYIQ